MENNSCSPVPPPTTADVFSLLLLLPVEAFVLTAAMGREDKEVLAFLTTRTADGDGHRRAASLGAGHPPAFWCDCFDCYLNYWRRWHHSPVQSLIDRAMEAYDKNVVPPLPLPLPPPGGLAMEGAEESPQSEADTNVHLSMEVIGLESSSDGEDLAAADATGGSEEEGYVVVGREEAAQAASSRGRQWRGALRFWRR